MPELTKVRQLLEYKERRSVYQGQYPDETGNLWSITVDGQARQVHQLRRELAIEFWTEELDLATATELIEEGRKNSQALLDEPEEIVVDDAFIGPPTLNIEFSLLKLANPDQEAYRLKFIIDPSISEKWHQYSFKLNAKDSTACVKCTTHQGHVSYRLSGENLVSRSGAGSVRLGHPAGNIRNWKLRATYISGHPARYSLDGDIVVSLR